jgi:serine O-acetyltransferase
LRHVEKSKCFLTQKGIALKLFKTAERGIKEIVACFAKIIFDKFMLDAEFVAQKDPSLTSIQEVIDSKTNSLLATFLYRIANFFYYANVTTDQSKTKTVCRQLMEHCLLLTAIDIHPGAKIGDKFFIDHGHGVVIGETCEIGERCNLFNGVILGSKNVVKAPKGKRHPTLKNNVTVCAGAKILGDITIGNNVFVSPSAVVLDDVEDNQKVLIVNQLQITKQDTFSYLPSQKMVIYGIVPKFKNTISILGEGFYNPNVIIKLKNNATLNYAIDYWDKNKIMVKFKNTTPFEKDIVKGVKCIVFSNNARVIIVNNLALEKALTSLCD